MTVNKSGRPDLETTLASIVEKLDWLSIKVEKIDTEVNKEIYDISAENKKFDDHFTDSPQATQHLVLLPFILITVTNIPVIIATILRR